VVDGLCSCLVYSHVLTLVPREVPLLEFGLLGGEVLDGGLGSTVALGNGECEGFIQRQADGLGAVYWLVNFETNVEELAGQEVCPGNGQYIVIDLLCMVNCSLVGREHASQSRAGSKTTEGLR
jgi:hypothetical protein